MATIKAIAHLNELTKDVDNDYYLTPEVKGTLTLEDVINNLKKREIATQNVNGLAFVKLVFEEIANLVTAGYNVHTDLFHASLNLKGSVLAGDLGHPISSDRLDISMKLSQSEMVRKLIKSVEVEVFEQSGAVGPVIQDILDPTENISGHLNPGSMVLIKGMRLAIKGDDPSCGVLFTSVSTPGTTVFLPASKIFPNTPTKLQFNLPTEIQSGDWTVTVTTQSSTSTLLKSPRTSNAFRVNASNDPIEVE